MKQSYWLLPLIFFIIQLIFTLNSLSQIRYEELAESVRNVFWLENRTIYDGVSSNVGWYGTLLIVYKAFGFTLHSAKYVRLILALVSLFCLAAVLKKYLGEKIALVPLLTIGLSPTYLYFNTLQTSYGIDLLYFPICLYLLLSIDFQKRWISYLKQILLWMVAMIAWMSYPTFVFYLPALFVLYLWKINQQSKREKFWPVSSNLIMGIFAFMLPFLVLLNYVRDKQLLWYDPKLGSGIFRGAGIFNPDWGSFWQNLSHTLGDLFFQAGSYYFEVAVTDFGSFYPIVTILFIFFLGFILVGKSRKLRLPLILGWVTLLFTLVIANLTADPTGYPGIRRNTPLLSVIYLFFTIGWSWIGSQKFLSSQLKGILLVIFLLIPFHHLLALPANYYSLPNSSHYQYSHIFNLAISPAESLELLTRIVIREDLKLSCQDPLGRVISCRYSEAYAAVAGSCLWNNLKCHQIWGYDSKSDKFIPLNIKLWEDYYFDH